MKIIKSKTVSEGAGVSLKRIFGFNEVPQFDPFLLLDNFGSDNPDDYMAGFPWHPHRGIETVTYMLEGEVEHGDSLGNQGVIQSGDIQWMTAGSGIIHQEMPKRYDGMMRGFQLWVNLPAAFKMMPPRYRDVKRNSIPEVTLKNGAKVKIISGEVDGVKGPVKDIVVDIEYLDFKIPANALLKHSFKQGFTGFAYIFEGEAVFGDQKIQSGHLILFDKGSEISVSTQDTPVRFLLISGEPVDEPVAWRGPIVMNTNDELKTAFLEYENGTFIK